uniref:Uncharacterized protein n=1 Tax=Urocitellus parryii TaxID=9999 RepID=A0A8D2HPJ8_UROPR
MFRGLSSWFGLQQPAAVDEPSQGDGQSAGDSPPEQPSETVAESTKEEQQSTEDQEFLHQARGLSNYLYNFASAATKKITESVAETAQTIKRSVEEGKIDDIIEKLGRLRQEDRKFKASLSNEAAVPPWVDSNDEETIQQQILALSAVSFLRYPEYKVLTSYPCTSL